MQTEDKVVCVCVCMCVLVEFLTLARKTNHGIYLTVIKFNFTSINVIHREYKLIPVSNFTMKNKCFCFLLYGSNFQIVVEVEVWTNSDS